MAQETWKGGAASARKAPVARPAVHGMRPMPSPIETQTPRGPPPQRYPMTHPGGPPYMRHGQFGYSPMGHYPPHGPLGYSPYGPPYPPHPAHAAAAAAMHHQQMSSAKTPGGGINKGGPLPQAKSAPPKGSSSQHLVTPSSPPATPKTARDVKEEEVGSCKKKQKLSTVAGETEAANFEFGGTALPKIPRSVAVSIFSYLSTNVDRKKVAVICKGWNSVVCNDKTLTP